MMRRTRPKLALLALALVVMATGLVPGSTRSAVGQSLEQRESDRQRPQFPADSLAALEALTSAVAAQLRCPVCQGLSIQDSPTELALEMRAVVRDQLAAGNTPDEVRAYFVSKYGEWILLEPKPEGFNLAVYLLPVIVLVLGGATIVLAVRRWTRQGLAGAEAPDGEGAGVGAPGAEFDHV
jgi:cytochrome c-type biogenesis protein CcmH/NrfF